MHYVRFVLDGHQALHAGQVVVRRVMVLQHAFAGFFFFLGEVGGGGWEGGGHALSIEKDIGEFNKLWELNGLT